MCGRCFCSNNCFILVVPEKFYKSLIDTVSIVIKVSVTVFTCVCVCVCVCVYACPCVCVYLSVNVSKLISNS